MCRSADDLLLYTHPCMVRLVYSDSNAYLDSTGEEGGRERGENGGRGEGKGGEEGRGVGRGTKGKDAQKQVMGIARHCNLKLNRAHSVRAPPHGPTVLLYVFSHHKSCSLYECGGGSKCVGAHA